MRVCVAAPQFPFVHGGAELHVELLVKALRRCGHQVDLLSIPYIWKASASVLDQALAWRLLDVTGDFLGPGEGIDLLIATKFPSYLIRHPRKVAWVFHQQREVYDLYGSKFSPLGSFNDDIALRQAIKELDCQGLAEARAVYANSQNVANRLRDFCGIEAEALYAPPKLADQITPGEDRGYLFVAARLDRVKRIDLTLHAIAAAAGDVELKVAGRGPEMDALKELARHLGIADRVDFLGFVSDKDLMDLYGHCTAVVLTPRDEDFGFTTLEAFYAAKPVITTSDAGGILEFVTEGITGLVTKPAAEQIGHAIDLLWRDREYGRELGLRGRVLVRKKASWDRCIAALTDEGLGARQRALPLAHRELG